MNIVDIDAPYQTFAQRNGRYCISLITLTRFPFDLLALHTNGVHIQQ